MQSFANRIQVFLGYRLLSADTTVGLNWHAQRGGLRFIPIQKGTLLTVCRASVKELEVRHVCMLRRASPYK